MVCLAHMVFIPDVIAHAALHPPDVAPFDVERHRLDRCAFKDTALVVYLSTADNSIGPKTRYNAPSHHTLEGAMPWSRIFFTTNSLCWRSSGSSSCCLSLGPSQACPPHPCRPSPSASVLPSPKHSRA